MAVFTCDLILPCLLVVYGALPADDVCVAMGMFTTPGMNPPEAGQAFPAKHSEILCYQRVVNGDTLTFLKALETCVLTSTICLFEYFTINHTILSF